MTEPYTQAEVDLGERLQRLDAGYDQTIAQRGKGRRASQARAFEQRLYAEPEELETEWYRFLGGQKGQMALPEFQWFESRYPSLAREFQATELSEEALEKRAKEMIPLASPFGRVSSKKVKKERKAAWAELLERGFAREKMVTERKPSFGGEREVTKVKREFLLQPSFEKWMEGRLAELREQYEEETAEERLARQRRFAPTIRTTTNPPFHF